MASSRVRKASLPIPRSALRPCIATVGNHGLRPGPERKLPRACRIQEGNDRGVSLQWLRLETASRATGSAVIHNLSRFVPELRGSGTANARRPRRSRPGRRPTQLARADAVDTRTVSRAEVRRRFGRRKARSEREKTLREGAGAPPADRSAKSCKTR